MKQGWFGQSQQRLTARVTIFGALALGILHSPTAAFASPGGYATGSELCGIAPNAFPVVRIGMRDGFCAGLVASQQDGLVFPRSILQIPGSDKFVVADMVGFGSPNGKLLLLDPAQPAGHRIRELIGGLDQPFGLVRGIDNKVYASTAETIFRFDPLAANPKATVETIVRGLPGSRVTLSDGTVVGDAAHPLKAFVFDKTGKLYVNAGAPSDNCLPARATKPCAAGEGAAPLAAIWAFTPPQGGIFPALKPDDPNPPREIFARGLRNSMALAMHPDFPDAGFAFLQAENGRDLPDVFMPNEEINALEKGKHYGWPYCYDLKTVSPEYRSFLRTASPYKNLCDNATLYRPPLSLLPPHGAPLAMLYYHGAKFPALDGKLIVGLHGYRPTGSRILVYDVDEKGFPKISPPPVRYNVSCASEPSRPFQTQSAPQVAAAAFTELVSGWYRVNGVRPQGAPVGMTVASDGAIWVVEDKNRTILRIDATDLPAPPPLPCGNRTAGRSGKPDITATISSVLSATTSAQPGASYPASTTRDAPANRSPALSPYSPATSTTRSAILANGAGSNRAGTHSTTPPSRSGAPWASPAISPAICVATCAVRSPRWSHNASSRVPVSPIIGIPSPQPVWNSHRMERAIRCRTMPH